jgi:hypothetical protein
MSDRFAIADASMPRSDAAVNLPRSVEQQAPIVMHHVISTDTTRRTTTADSNDVIGTTTPGEYPYTPEQDRAFYDALQISIPPSVRFVYDLQRFSPAWLALKAQLQKLSPAEAALANINSIPPSLFTPDPREQTAYDYNLAQAFTIPGIYEPFRRGGVGKGGLQIPLSLIGSLLGLVEDVSPSISWVVEQPATEVEIVIYSIQAMVVARLFRGIMEQGNHTLTWNLLNDRGLRVPRGDYIAEVRVGNGAITRKRIRVE